MTRDLSDLLAETLDEQAAVSPLAPSAELRAGTLRRVRRRRGRRHAAETAGALAVAAVLTAGSWFGLRPSPAPEPAQTPTQAPAPTARPESAGLGLPPAVPVTDATLDQIGPGWLLSVRQPVYEAPGAARSNNGYEETVALTVAGQMLYLVSPTGEHFAVPADLDPERYVALTSWDPGARRAGVVMYDLYATGDPNATPGWIDLRTGAFTADDAAVPRPDVPDPERAHKRADAADGGSLWELPPDPGGTFGQIYAWSPGTPARKIIALEADARTLHVDPTGRSFLAPRADDDYDLVTIADGSTRHLQIRVAGKDCAVVSWLDPDTLLVACYDEWDGREPVLDDVAARRPALYRTDTTTQQTELVYEADPEHPFTQSPGLNPPVAHYVSDGVVVFPGILGAPGASTMSTCSDGVYLLTPAGVHALEQRRPPTLLHTRVVDGTVYVERTFTRAGPDGDPCGGTPGGTLSITSYDLDTGTSVEVLPGPAPAPGVQQWTSSISSWIAQGE